MGEREYGIYAYLWVWLLVAGGIGSVGLPVAALKLVPEYRTRGETAALRGFLRFSRTLGLLPSVALALAAAGLTVGLVSGEGAVYVPAALVALVILPLYVLTDVQTGIARAFDYMDLGLAADYLFRPVLLLAATGALAIAGQPGTALIVMLATLAGMAVTALVQGLVLQKRLRAAIVRGPTRTDLNRWVAVSWPLLTVSGFTLLLGSTDIIILKLFVGPEDIAVYFAATKIVAVASFVAYGVANTSAHRFAAHAASGDRGATARLAAETVSWTFWPTLAVAAGLAAFAGPLLSLFGSSFASGAPSSRFSASARGRRGRGARADGPLPWRSTAGRRPIYGLAFLLNAVLALVLIPPMGARRAAGVGDGARDGGQIRAPVPRRRESASASSC
jgi:O-antigen/teichoic acid export membrane protein